MKAEKIRIDKQQINNAGGQSKLVSTKLSKLKTKKSNNEAAQEMMIDPPLR